MNKPAQKDRWSWDAARQEYLQTFREPGNPSLGEAMARRVMMSGAFYQNHVKHPWLTTPTLLAYLEGEITRTELFAGDSDSKQYAAFAGLPATDATVRVLQRMRSDQLHPAYLPLIRELFTRPIENWPAEITHLPRLNLAALACLDDGDLVLQTTWWMTVASQPQGLSPLGADALLQIATTSHVIQALIYRYEPPGMKAMLRNVTTITQYVDLGRKLVENQRWDDVVDSCPLDGAIGFRPLLSERDVRNESKAMGNCLDSHHLHLLHPARCDDIWRAYAVEQPVRATLLVQRNQWHWVIVQFVDRDNLQLPAADWERVYKLMANAPARRSVATLPDGT